MPRRSTALATVLVLVGGLLAAAGSAGATSRQASRPTAAAAHPWPKDPARNLNPKPDVTRYEACSSHPLGAACGAKIVQALNHARKVLGKPNYALPPKFLSLSGPDQLLVLTNDDRHAYGETSIRGRNAALDENAAYWAERVQDPHGVPVIHHHQASFIGSNLAVGGGGPYVNPLFAYYLWMYFDGPGGPNADCPSAHASGCWGHRHVTLYKHSTGEQVLMGAGMARPQQGEVSWTELYETFSGAVNVPLIPTVTGLSPHTGSTAGGTTVVVDGFGFHRAAWVHVLKQHARIVDRSNNRLTIKTPAHKAGAGYVFVHGSGGDSQHTAADRFTYHH